MEHMKERWLVKKNMEAAIYFGTDRLAVGYMSSGIGDACHGDLAARTATAQAICDEHNAALDRAAISDAAFDRACAEPAAQLLKPVMTNADLQAAIDATVYNIERAKGEAEARLERHLDELLAVQAQRADAAETT
jgi:hypothetical protein